jgi:hypothetical protein
MVPAQWLHLLNSSHNQRKLEQGPKLRAIVNSGRKPEEMEQELYQTIRSRFPTVEEVRRWRSWAGRGEPVRTKSREDGWTSPGLDQQHRVLLPPLTAINRIIERASL